MNRYIEQEGYLSGVALYRFTNFLTASAALDGRLSKLDGNGTNQAHPTRATLNASAAIKYASEALTLTGRLNYVGTTETTFSPDVPITREQLAAILYRYAQSKGQGFTGLWAFPLNYPDAAEVSAENNDLTAGDLQ